MRNNDQATTLKILLKELQQEQKTKNNYQGLVVTPKSELKYFQNDSNSSPTPESGYQN